MSKHAFIKLVEGSAATAITLDDVKAKLERYIEMTSKTGKQLGWDYAGHAFPYTLEETEQGEDKWLLLRGKDPSLYRYIVIGVGAETRKEDAGEEEAERPYIQVTLPSGATHGDKGKANEFCKYLAREFQAELHLFNGRIMHFEPQGKRKK